MSESRPRGLRCIVDLPTSYDHLRYVLPWLNSLFWRSNSLADRKPWVVLAARERIRHHLAPGASVFEYGSGGSTLWFLDHGCSVTSIEHDAEWYQHLSQRLRRDEWQRLSYMLLEPDRSMVNESPEYLSSAEKYLDFSFRRYVESISDYDNESFDVILVDGRSRPGCLLRAWPKLRHGGLLILDDSHRSRYQSSMDLLAAQRHRYHGPAAYSRWFGESTIWEKQRAGTA